MDLNLPSNSLVSLLRKSEFSVLLLGFEKLGLGLDNCGRTTKKRPVVASIVYASKSVASGGSSL